ncbi:MAG: amylo-alpha-1,6-glucosidase [Paludibacteraceae bacterium]|nr:amylo-alpha-1,6-glucosidase [Paludibacteraceae bacterium]
MSYLNFDKTLLLNLERSLRKEMIHTNRAGAYMSSTLVDCNTRKYHGLLVVPLPELGNENYVLLSSLDETVIQHGAEFNLGIHQYGETNFSPSGQKYIREFDCTSLCTTTFRVGGVILTKERMLVSGESRVFIRYTLLESGSPVTLRLKPYLAFRSVHALTHANPDANSDVEPIKNGQRIRLYDGFPYLNMQFSKKAEYKHNPLWYKDIYYQKEDERGYECREDQLVPGSFELSMRKGESVIFAAGTTEGNPSGFKTIWNKEQPLRIPRNDMFSCLKNSACQLYKHQGDKCYLMAGYPWFGAQAREEFISVASCTLDIDRPDDWEAIVDQTAIPDVELFLKGEHTDQCGIQGMSEPDALLWLVRAFQKFAHKYSIQEAARRYGKICKQIIDFYQKQAHPRTYLHPNGLLWVDGKHKPATWMNVIEDGKPVTPRTGYVVELNSLWYNAMRFTAELMRANGQKQTADLLEYRAELVKDVFVTTFWNGVYLDDYVTDGYHNHEVRPNQIWAAALPYSPLDMKQKKAVVDICTKELLTPRGLRTLSPKSGDYRPVYIGGQKERDHNLHNGPVWPFTIAAYARAYMSVYHRSGISFMQRLLVGFEMEMKELTIGTINELYDGNPPYKGHGGQCYAPSIAAVISVIDTMKHFETQQNG